MQLSIIITIYNRALSLKRCFESILNQSFTDYEIIAVDDGSDDGSINIINEYVSAYPDRIRTVYQDHAGVAEARNAGLAAASGEFITYVDSDDYLMPDALAELAGVQAGQDADILLFDAVESYPDGRRNVFPPFYDGQAGVEEGELTAAQYLLARPCPWNQWTRKSLFAKTFGDRAPFPVGLQYEDLATLPLLGTAAGKIYYCRKTCYCYVQSTYSIMRGSEYRDSYKDIFRVADILKERLKEDYPEETEYLWWEHLLVSGGKRFLAADKLMLAGECADKMKAVFPNWRENAYVRKEPVKKRVLAGMLENKHFSLLKLLGK